MKKRAHVIKSTDGTWPKWGVVRPDCGTQWFTVEARARKLAASYNNGERAREAVLRRSKIDKIAKTIRFLNLRVKPTKSFKPNPYLK